MSRSVPECLDVAAEGGEANVVPSFELGEIRLGHSDTVGQASLRQVRPTSEVSE